MEDIKEQLNECKEKPRYLDDVGVHPMDFDPKNVVDQHFELERVGSSVDGVHGVLGFPG